jgi:hypothetical protein
MIVAGSCSACFVCGQRITAIGGALSLVVALLLIGISVLAVSRRWRLLSGAASACGRFFATCAPSSAGIEDYVYDFFARRQATFCSLGYAKWSFTSRVWRIYVALSLIGYHLHYGLHLRVG